MKEQAVTEQLTQLAQGARTDQGFAENPSEVLEKIFNEIHQHQMQGIPVVNPALKVEAIEFGEWEGHWLGVLITPWFMNLLLLPKLGSAWPELKHGKGNELVLSFPQGSYKFSAREEDQIGSYLSCSLASPVHEWKSHAEIRQTAVDVMRLIKSLPVVQISDDEPVAEACEMSRRGFLRGGAPA